MTYREALEQGWQEVDMKMHRGYIGKKIDPMSQELMEAGSYRRGEYYVLIHCPFSTRYCYRLYLRPPK